MRPLPVVTPWRHGWKARPPDITIIAAIAQNGVIGAGGHLPWSLPGDLRHFRRITLGHPVIMGRRTWVSIGHRLDGRLNIVVSRRLRSKDVGNGVRVAAGFHDALKRAGPGRVMIIGGAGLYAAALPLAGRMEITRVCCAPPGDVVFPPIDPQDWMLVARSALRCGPGDSAPFAFCTYRRRRAEKNSRNKRVEGSASILS